MTSQPDQLLRDALGGDSLALQRLLLGQFSSLERHIAARIPTEHQSLLSADDMLQETFSQAFRDVGKLTLQHEGEFNAWLRTVAENRLSDAIKALNRKKRGGAFRRLENQGLASGSLLQLVERLCDESRTPGRSVVRREAAQAIQVHVAALPDGERDAIRAKYFGGCEVADIAKQLGRSPGAVRGLLHRAHRRLADLLGQSSQWFSR